MPAAAFGRCGRQIDSARALSSPPREAASGSEPMPDGACGRCGREIGLRSCPVAAAPTSSWLDAASDARLKTFRLTRDNSNALGGSRRDESLRPISGFAVLTALRTQAPSGMARRRARSHSGGLGRGPAAAPVLACLRYCSGHQPVPGREAASSGEFVPDGSCVHQAAGAAQQEPGGVSAPGNERRPSPAAAAADASRHGLVATRAVVRWPGLMSLRKTAVLREAGHPARRCGR